MARHRPPQDEGLVLENMFHPKQGYGPMMSARCQRGLAVFGASLFVLVLVAVAVTPDAQSGQSANRRLALKN